MSRTSWIIKVLNDSFGGYISTKNQMWLSENAESLGRLTINVADCVCNTFDIAEEWPKKKSKLIQNGSPILFKADFNPLKEALLITASSEVYLYSPKSFEEKL